ncbi:MAG: RluA family pseudouridine synthase [Planctomycetota bacterium]
MGLFPKDRNLADSPDRVVLPVRANDFQARREEFAIRLDAFLQRRLPWRSRTSIQGLIRDGTVRVLLAGPGPEEAPGEGTAERRCSRLLRHGMCVVVAVPPAHRLPRLAAESADLAILFEDDDVLCVDKPPFLPVHPSGRHLADSLIQRVHARYRAAGAGERLPLRLGHRLDRETSGAVLVGKGDAAHRHLRRQFEAGEVEKDYLAIVRGSPAADEGLVTLPLGPAHAGAVRLKMIVSMDGLPAETSWTVVERHGAVSLVACRPRTGRQHQIRVHLAAIGHPVVGDKLYGPGEEYFLRAAAGTLTPADLRALGLPRHALHCHRLAWRSPSAGTRCAATSPLPADMRALLSAAAPEEG